MYAFRNLNQILTLKSAHQKNGRNLKPEDLSIIENSSIIFDDSKIHWVGSDRDFPSHFEIVKEVSLPGHVLTPEIVDSHTHLVFGGNRAFEYTLRLNGADYEEIAKSGGGILSTMKNTLESSPEELFQIACKRIEEIYSYGIGTIEIKSGYALTFEKEKELTGIIHKLKEKFKDRIQIFNTFLAAHAVPSNFKSSSEYIHEVVLPLLREVRDKVDAVDIFHEVGYFDEKDVRDLFNEAKKLNIKIKSHADEFNDNKGASLACEFKALSCDHLLCTSQKGVSELSQSDTVATLLPGTALFLGKKLANARAFLDAGCKVALASDYNPGSSHCDNLVLLASISAKSLNMNSAELWSAITLNSAHALGLQKQGAIIENMSARFSVFQCQSIDEITYHWGKNFSIPWRALYL
jgi:imidazolonepropionase